jgi:hypothetical protein
VIGSATSPVVITVEERDALQAHISEVAGVCAWAAYLRGGPMPPLNFDAAILLQVDLGWVDEPSGFVELELPPDQLCEMFTRLGEHVVICKKGDPRTRLVAQAYERVLAAQLRGDQIASRQGTDVSIDAG